MNKGAGVRPATAQGAAGFRGPEPEREKLTASLLFNALPSPELRDRTFTVAAGLFVLGTVLQLYAAVES